MVIKDLDRDPERQDRIRRTGVVQALLRHDWVYRWEAVLKTAGLEPMQGLLKRKERLRKLAGLVGHGEMEDLAGVQAARSRIEACVQTSNVHT